MTLPFSHCNVMSHFCIFLTFDISEWLEKSKPKSCSFETSTGIILYMRPANERQCFILMLCLIGWAHIQNDPCITLCLGNTLSAGTTFGPLFTKWTDVLRQDLMKSQSCKILVSTFPITLKCQISERYKTQSHSFKTSEDLAVRCLSTQRIETLVGMGIWEFSNSLHTMNVIQHHRSWSTLVELMTWCLPAPSCNPINYGSW